MSREKGDVLFFHHLDLSSPYQSTVPYYLVSKAAETKTVHVLCRNQASVRDDRTLTDDVVFHDINTGEIPLVSGMAFVLMSSIYAVVLGAVYRYDVVYSFQNGLIQGWLASTAADARYVVGLQSVPVRQWRDFMQSQHDAVRVGERVMFLIYSQYAHIIGIILEDATEVVCLTDGIRSLTETVYDVDLGDAHVIGMGIETEKFARERPLERDGGEERWTITYVGTISSIRGIGDLIEAISMIPHDVEVVLAGTGTDVRLSKLKDKAAEIGVDDRVEWLGVLPHDEVATVLQQSDVAVSPLSDIESFRISFPAKVLEYMAAGCLVVASDIEPHRNLIDHGVNGFLYEGGADALADAISTCIERDARHEQLRENARRTAQRYDWDEIYAKHERVMFA